MMDGERIYVKSHVARDLLQSAALFKTDKVVVWEYVSNGLQYVDPGVSPVVQVKLDTKRKLITIQDNGRGMDWEGLRNFFIMHGENQDRKAGQPGRGRFGTGKSAAFGIAEVLRITTVRNGRRSQVELSRTDIEIMNSEDPIPVRVIGREIPTGEPNGTLVELEGVQLKSLDQAGIIQFIERHLARWPKSTTVVVNNHECEFAEPPISYCETIQPTGVLADVLGDVTLVVKVAAGPLGEELRGVSIYSNGVWYETTLAGSEGREMAQYIFGEIDVPRLDEDKSLISPFDQSRSMQLNPNNEVVRAIYTFVGQNVDRVRRKLVAEERERSRGEEAKKLAAQAAEIARIINEDFAAFGERLSKIKAKMRGFVDLYDEKMNEEEGNELVSGSTELAKTISDVGGPGSSGEGQRSDGTEPRNLAPQVISGGDELIGQRAKSKRDSQSPRGGFQIAFKQMGSDGYRAAYVRDERTIYINLDHPQVIAARGQGGIDDIAFRRLAYEIAFSEYSIALAQELIPLGHFIDLTDPVQHIRETLNRIAHRGAELYSR